MEPLFLTLGETLDIHADQLQRYGGAPGLRDRNLLESALAMPRASAGGQYVHPDLAHMAAAYLFHIIRNHPFVDGNKRVALVAAMVFLMLNGEKVEVEQETLYAVTMSAAKGTLSKDTLAEYFRTWLKK